MVTRKIFVLGILISVVSLGLSQKSRMQKPPDGNSILKNLKESFESVHDFIVSIDAEIHMDRVNVPKMIATLYFKKPNKINFESKGFLMIPREGVAFNPALIAEKYDVIEVSNDSAKSKPVYKLQLLAKDRKTPMQELTLIVDPEHWTVERVETVPYDGRSMVLEFTYALQQDRYWLPSKLVVRLGTAGEKSPLENSLSPQAQQPMQDFQQVVPRTGSVIILYSTYTVNSGIADSVFEKKTK